MTYAKLPAVLILSSVVAGLVCVSPALSSKDPSPAVTPLPAAAVGESLRRPSRPPERSRARVADMAQTAVCTSARRSLWLKDDGWVVRRVSVCR